MIADLIPKLRAEYTPLNEESTVSWYEGFNISHVSNFKEDLTNLSYVGSNNFSSYISENNKELYICSIQLIKVEISIVK